MAAAKEIMIGCDHGGYRIKEIIKERLAGLGYMVTDAGCDSEEIVRYPYYAAKVAKAVSLGQVERGILICSTGIGMSMIANKYPGVRAALCTSTYMGKMTRAHNDANILCLGGRITGEFEILDILDIWLNTEYEGGRHEISLGLIAEAEKELMTGRLWDGEECPAESVGENEEKMR